MAMQRDPEVGDIISLKETHGDEWFDMVVISTQPWAGIVQWKRYSDIDRVNSLINQGTAKAIREHGDLVGVCKVKEMVFTVIQDEVFFK